MTYPVLKQNDAKEVAVALTMQMERFPGSAALDEHSFGNLGAKVQERQGGDWQRESFLANARTFTRNILEDRRYPDFNDTVLNERFAKHIVEQAKLVDKSALQDPDFWRYLTLFPYRTYTRLRDQDYSAGRFGANGNAGLNRWTLISGYLWGSRLYLDDDASLISAYRKARLAKKFSEGWVKDFYINNVIRRKWASLGSAARAFVKVVSSNERLFDVSNEYRPTPKFGGLVGRASENIYFFALTEDELTGYFGNLAERNMDSIAPKLVSESDL
jgi:hypothetical protein